MEDDTSPDPENLGLPPSFFPYNDGFSSFEQHEGSGEPIACKVEAVYQTQTGESVQRYVLLSDGSRRLPIVIGGFEATAITLPLEGQQPDRPLTHDLMKVLLDRVGAQVVKVVVDDLWGTTYYAKIHLKVGKEESTIDARPSDAIALAVRCDSPIFVMDSILEHHGSS